MYCPTRKRCDDDDIRPSFFRRPGRAGPRLLSKRWFLILVGGSGPGKSTLLNMIAGLESVTSGEIRIGERVVNELPPKDRDIAMVFQSYAL
jgi:ABC-type polar amino acid transport system ATPase subunit